MGTPEVKQDKPGRDELAEAQMKAKQAGHSSSDTKHTEHGAAIVRYYLGPKWANVPTDTIRLWLENLSRSGGELGTKKRTPKQNSDAAINRLLKQYPRATSHSEEYKRIHESQEYKVARDALKRALDWHCQLCWRDFTGDNLFGHILDYAEWDRPGRILILCQECHDIADALRRRGKEKIDVKVGNEPTLFSSWEPDNVRVV